MNELNEKQKKLQNILCDMGSVAVAFSAGVDSTYLLKVARNTLGDNVVAFTAATDTFPDKELAETEEFCRSENIRMIKIRADVFSIDGFRSNRHDRCYHCKKELFCLIKRAALEQGITNVIEGSNLDDAGDYRPGMRAISELGVRSPLKEAGLTKNDIRTLSKELGLKTWDKPSFACLATRIAYGEDITVEKIAMIGEAEEYIASLGFRQYRVRLHDGEGRIELPPEDIERFLSGEVRENVRDRLHALGFKFVSLDLDGYRTGSMNAMLG